MREPLYDIVENYRVVSDNARLTLTERYEYYISQYAEYETPELSVVKC